MRNYLSITLALSATTFVTGVRIVSAQDAPPPPETTTTEVVIDERERALREEQEALETEGAPSADDAVIEEQDVAAPRDPGMSHENQVGIRFGIAAPYVFAVKYDDGPLCDRGGETFCRRRGAIGLDVDLGFGIGESVEASIGARLSIEDDEAARAAPRVFSLGLRAYTNPTAAVKIYLGGRAILDVTDSDVDAWDTIDVGIRGEFGLIIDVVRYLGLYVQVGETLQFLRSFAFITDGSAGIQVRFP